MPRQPRLDLAGVPQHVVQRGNNRQPCFLREQDYRCYLAQLGDAARAHGCRIHAYVLLMTNHVRLLLTPEAIGAVARMMQSLGRRYVGPYPLERVLASLLSGLRPQRGIQYGTRAQAQQGDYPKDRKSQARLLGLRLDNAIGCRRYRAS